MVCFSNRKPKKPNAGGKTKGSHLHTTGESLLGLVSRQDKSIRQTTSPLTRTSFHRTQVCWAFVFQEIPYGIQPKGNNWFVPSHKYLPIGKINKQLNSNFFSFLDSFIRKTLELSYEWKPPIGLTLKLNENWPSN